MIQLKQLPSAPVTNFQTQRIVRYRRLVMLQIQAPSATNKSLSSYEDVSCRKLTVNANEYSESLTEEPECS